jgi:DNA repair protein RecO (recombination protein O)
MVASLKALLLDSAALTPENRESSVRQDEGRLYRCEAIVLSRMDFGEADRILTVFSRQHGKLRVIAKGARRPLSRLGSHLEYFCLTKLMLARGRELDVVTGAETVDPHIPIRESLDALGHASHMVEILGRLTEDRQENRAVFELLASSLQLLDAGANHFHTTRHYELALLTLLGYRPELYRCIECQEKLRQSDHAFVAQQGGFLCELCQGRLPTVYLVSVDAQKYLRLLDRSGLSAVMCIEPGPALREEVEAFFGTYLRSIAEKDLNSLRIWRELNDAPRP